MPSPSPWTAAIRRHRRPATRRALIPAQPLQRLYERLKPQGGIDYFVLGNSGQLRSRAANSTSRCSPAPARLWTRAPSRLTLSRPEFSHHVHPDRKADRGTYAGCRTTNFVAAFRLPGSRDRRGACVGSHPRIREAPGAVVPAGKERSPDSVHDAASCAAVAGQDIPVIFVQCTGSPEHDGLGHNVLRERAGITPAEALPALAPFFRTVAPLTDTGAGRAAHKRNRARHLLQIVVQPFRSGQGPVCGCVRCSL
jgi:hypothetical protein